MEGLILWGYSCGGGWLRHVVDGLKLCGSPAGDRGRKRDGGGSRGHGGGAGLL